MATQIRYLNAAAIGIERPALLFINCFDFRNVSVGAGDLRKLIKAFIMAIINMLLNLRGVL